ncbi:MAG: PAS domain-containing protein [Deltaproteobacteria bacterium]|nr:PAS domain-containing protein [Deltaproteobacteria bacterium]
MPSKNSILFPILTLAFLALIAVGGLLLFYLLPYVHRPTLLWYGAAALAVIAIVGTVVFVVRLQRRLQYLAQFLSSASERDKPPSLPVWNEDEVGALERGIQHLMLRQDERLRALQAEQKKLEAVLQSMAEGVVVINPSGNVVLCNRAAQELFDLRQDQVWLGKPLQAFSRHPLLQELLREVANRRPGDSPVTREMHVETKDERYLAASAMQICEDGATVSGYVLVFYDLTRIKRLESVRADFVANVSHELRTPLTAIKGYAETLLNGALKEPVTAQRFLEIIDRHSERLSRLIDDLLTLSNLELGKTELLQKDVSIPDLVNEVFEVVQEKAERAGISLIRDCSTELPVLIGDSDRLQQALVNLVDNAIKYTPDGGTVTVSAQTVQNSGFLASSSKFQSSEHPTPNTQHPTPLPHVSGPKPQTPNEWVELTVADTGCGIPEEDLPRLTQRFYRVDKARSRELGGTGLGLAIVKHIVQGHNGFLRIDSKLKHGTTVQLFLPCRSPELTKTTPALHS